MAAHAARYAFNEIARELHTRKLIRLTGAFRGLVPVFPGDTDRKMELTWPPSEKAAALAFCSAVEETGMKVMNFVGE